LVGFCTIGRCEGLETPNRLSLPAAFIRPRDVVVRVARGFYSLLPSTCDRYTATTVKDSMSSAATLLPTQVPGRFDVFLTRADFLDLDHVANQRTRGPCGNSCASVHGVAPGPTYTNVCANSSRLF
jgi:hypothetical protein